MIKKGYRITSLVLFAFGILFALNSKLNITGNVIGTEIFSETFSGLLSIAFLFLALLVLMAGKRKFKFS